MLTLDHDTGQEAVACRPRQTCTSWCQLTLTESACETKSEVSVNGFRNCLGSLGAPRGPSGPPGLLGALWVPRAPSGSLWVPRGLSGPLGPLGGLRGPRGPTGPLGVPRGPPGSLGGPRGPSGAGYQSSLFGDSFFGLPSDRISKFTDRWTYSGEKLSFGTSFAYTVSEQVWLVLCCTCHESIHLSGSWPFIDSAHVMVHAEVAVACVC